MNLTFINTTLGIIGTISGILSLILFSLSYNKDRPILELDTEKREIKKDKNELEFLINFKNKGYRATSIYSIKFLEKKLNLLLDKVRMTEIKETNTLLLADNIEADEKRKEISLPFNLRPNETKKILLRVILDKRQMEKIRERSKNIDYEFIVKHTHAEEIFRDKIHIQNFSDNKNEINQRRKSYIRDAFLIIIAILFIPKLLNLVNLVNVKELREIYIVVGSVIFGGLLSIWFNHLNEENSRLAKKIINKPILMIFLFIILFTFYLIIVINLFL